MEKSAQRQRIERLAHEIGQKLAKNSHRPQLGYHFTVVDSPEVNAFALPGGYIYVTRGILAYLGALFIWHVPGI